MITGEHVTKKEATHPTHPNQRTDKDKSQAIPILRHACMRSEIFMQFVSWPLSHKERGKEAEREEETKKVPHYHRHEMRTGRVR